MRTKKRYKIIAVAIVLCLAGYAIVRIQNVRKAESIKAQFQSEADVAYEKYNAYLADATKENYNLFTEAFEKLPATAICMEESSRQYYYFDSIQLMSELLKTDPEKSMEQKELIGEILTILHKDSDNENAYAKMFTFQLSMEEE